MQDGFLLFVHNAKLVTIISGLFENYISKTLNDNMGYFQFVPLLTSLNFGILFFLDHSIFIFMDTFIENSVPSFRPSNAD
jgi:hypothetical protein